MTAQTVSLLQNTPLEEENYRFELLARLRDLRSEQINRVGGTAPQPEFFNPTIVSSLLIGPIGTALLTRTETGEQILGGIGAVTEEGITEDQNAVQRFTTRFTNLLASPFSGDAAAKSEGLNISVTPIVLGVAGVLVLFLFFGK